VRPGGLRNNSGVNESVELRPADTQYIGGISRSKVAEVVVTALVTPESSEKIVEVLKTFQYTFLSSSSIPPKPISKI
jgi:hypothetical protein